MRSLPCAKACMRNARNPREQATQAERGTEERGPMSGSGATISNAGREAGAEVGSARTEAASGTKERTSETEAHLAERAVLVVARKIGLEERLAVLVIPARLQQLRDEDTRDEPRRARAGAKQTTEQKKLAETRADRNRSFRSTNRKVCRAQTGVITLPVRLAREKRTCSPVATFTPAR